MTTTTGGPAADEIDQLKAKVQWLAEKHAATAGQVSTGEHARMIQDRDRWRATAVAAQSALDQIGIDAQEVYAAHGDDYHDANCWRRHVRCFADRISLRIEGEK